MTARPRVMVLHNRYNQSGGEEAVVAAEVELLRSAGHEVILHEWNNAGITGLRSKARAFRDAAGNHAAADWLEGELARTGAGLVHVHNFFPRLSPAVHMRAAERGVAVVQTLHNYRLMCAAGTFLRGGRICEECVEHGRHRALVHTCYRGSVAGSLASIRMQRATIANARWRQSVHRFIALTGFARDKLVAGGLPAERVAIKGNFVAERHDEKGGKREGALFVGRLAPEKGVQRLVEAWAANPDISLTIAGTGPLEAGLKAMAPPNVHFAGHCGADEIARLMQRSRVLVMPSLWYEGFPRTLVEAFAARLPVVASDIGSLSEIAGQGKYAALVPPGDFTAFAKEVRQLCDDADRCAALANAAHAKYRQDHTPAASLAALEDIYENALRAVKDEGTPR